MIAEDQKGFEVAPVSVDNLHEIASLRQLHSAVIDKYLRYQMMTLRYRGDIAATEHVALRDAVLERDALRACNLLTRPAYEAIHAPEQRSPTFAGW